MKKEEYTVWFEDSWEKCYSFSFQEAAIVACARRIEAGLNTKITSIGCKEYPEILVEACKVILVMLDQKIKRSIEMVTSHVLKRIKERQIEIDAEYCQLLADRCDCDTAIILGVKRYCDDL